MKSIKSSGYTNEITGELDQIRRLAAEAGVRVLDDLELGWVSGGDPVVGWETTPPGP